MKTHKIKRFVSFALILVFVISFSSLTACQINNENRDVGSIEWITPDDSIDMDGMNLYWQHDNVYFPADENAKISLYVHAEKNEDGMFMFDDGQDWLLIMETSLGDYPLFPRKYVQLGGVSCSVFNDADDILVMYKICEK